MQKTRAVDVARYFIHLAAAEAEPEYLSPMRLQKLLYYAQGWSLGIRDEVIFADPIQAWTYGPVVESVFQEFRKCGDRPISEEEGKDEGLTADQKTFLKSVWESYKDYSAISLSRMTHEEPPWIAARRGLPPEVRCTREISVKSMREFFKSIVAK